jgi:phenylacetate-CoA ligase
VLSVVRRNSYDDNDTGRIKKELGQKLGKGVRLEIAFTDQIPRTKSGKHRFLIQNLPISDIAPGASHE